MPLEESKVGKWEFKHLRNSLTFCANIPPYNKQSYDVRFIEPRYVLYCVSKDPFAPIEDFILARIKNRTGHHDGEDYIVLMTAAHSGVAKKLQKAFTDGGVHPLPSIDFTEDPRRRFGMTILAPDLTTRNPITDMLTVIDKLVPLTFTIRLACEQILAPKFSDAAILKKLPYDGQFEPPYFKAKAMVLYIGPSYETYWDDNQTIPAKLPDIHQAILDRDEKKLEEILEQNPRAATHKDPWGLPAHALASKIGTDRQNELLLEARLKFPPTSRGEALQLHNDKRRITESITIFSKPDTEKYRKEYLEKIREPIPVRSELHQACINGDMPAVKNILMQDKSRINEIDPRGFTPAILAAANGHAELLQWLLEQGASCKKSVNVVSIGNYRTILHLIDHAINVVVLRVMLEHGIEPDDYSQQFKKAIVENNIPIAECFMSYLKKFPMLEGISFIDFAILHSVKFGSAMLQKLLLAYDNYAPSGPYDDDIPKEVVAVLANHNAMRSKRLNKKSARMRIVAERLTEDTVVTELSSGDMHITSVIKSLNQLTYAEYQQVATIFFATFDLIKNDTQENRQKYFATQLQERQGKAGFINLFYDRNNKQIIAFMASEIIHSEHPDVGEFYLYHAKLAATDDRYAAHGLVGLAFRGQLALKRLNPHLPVFTSFESILPGFGLSILPDHAHFSPKYAFSRSFTQHVVKLMGEELNGNMIKTALKVKSRQVEIDNLKLNFFRWMTGNDPRQAMLVHHEVDAVFMNAYLKKFAENGIGETNIDILAQYLHRFISNCEIERFVTTPKI